MSLTDRKKGRLRDALLLLATLAASWWTFSRVTTPPVQYGFKITTETIASSHEVQVMIERWGIHCTGIKQIGLAQYVAIVESTWGEFITKHLIAYHSDILHADRIPRMIAYNAVHSRRY